MTSDMPSPHPEVLAAHLDGETVLLHLGTKRYFRLNRTGALVWRSLEAGRDETAMVAELVDAFEVSDVEAAAEVQRLVSELREQGLLVAREGGA